MVKICMTNCNEIKNCRNCKHYMLDDERSHRYGQRTWCCNAVGDKYGNVRWEARK